MKAKQNKNNRKDNTDFHSGERRTKINRREFVGTVFAGVTVLSTRAALNENFRTQHTYKSKDESVASPSEDVVIYTQNVTDFGARPNTKDDATSAFQKALDAARQMGGGIVFAPAGSYRFLGNLVIPPGVTLRGIWLRPGHGVGSVGTILEVTADKGNEQGTAFLRISFAGCLRDLTIIYPEQDPLSIVPYPWTISVSPQGKESCYSSMVRNLTLVNSYQGILVGGAGHLHFIKHVYGTPLRHGIAIDFCADIGRMAECDFRTEYWEQCGLPGSPTTAKAIESLHQFIKENGTAFSLGYSDTELLTNMRAEGYHYGLQLVKMRRLDPTLKQTPPRPNSYGQVYGLELLNCWRAIQADNIQELVGFEIAASRFSADDCCLDGTGDSRILFNSCSFRTGSAGTCIIHPTDLLLQNCLFEDWGIAAVSADHGLLSVTDCKFQADKLAIVTGSELQSVIIVGNKFAGSPRLDIKTKSALIDHSKVTMDKAATPHYNYAPMRKPESLRIINVRENPYNASGDGKTDDTAPIQKALDALGTNGGTAFLPAGQYRIEGKLHIPTGVELRGIWDGSARTTAVKGRIDVPGTVLLACSGKGNHDGQPLVSIEGHAGLRGLTIIYPEQNNIQEVVEYPPTIIVRGKDSYVISVELSNPFLGIDIAGDGHLISNLYASPMHLGIRVGKGTGTIIEDYHCHPQFMGGIMTGGNAQNYMANSSDCILFEGCRNLTIINFSVWMAHDAMRFVEKNSTVRVINPTFDQVALCYGIDEAKYIETINTQGGYRCIETGPAFEGKAKFFNSLWRGEKALTFEGSGIVQFQADRFMTGHNAIFDKGTIRIEGGIWNLEPCTTFNKAVRVEALGVLDLDGLFNSMKGPYVKVERTLKLK